MATWGCLPKWVIGAKLINSLVGHLWIQLYRSKESKKKKILWTNAEFIVMFIEFL